LKRPWKEERWMTNVVTWRSSVEKEAEQQGKKLAEVADLAQNRIRFKYFLSILHFTVESKN
jgi:hypothetical protein